MSAPPASGSPGFWVCNCSLALWLNYSVRTLQGRTKNFVSSLDAPAIIAGIGASIIVFVGATLAVRRIFQSETPQPSQVLRALAMVPWLLTCLCTSGC